MIRMQKLTDDFTKANPDIKLELGHARRERAAPEGDDRHRHQGRPVRRADHRHLRGSDLGARRAGWCRSTKLGADYDADDLLPAIRSGLTVDGKLYAAPFYGESSMVMYRKDLMEKAGLKMPDAPTWTFIKRSRRQDDRQGRRRLRHLPARQGRLGREHGVPDRDREFVRRALVRREMEAAVQHAGMEGDARLLRAADEGRRPSRRLVERLQREPRAVQRRQVRHVDRRHGRGVAS